MKREFSEESTNATHKKVKTGGDCDFYDDKTIEAMEHFVTPVTHHHAIKDYIGNSSTGLQMVIMDASYVKLAMLEGSELLMSIGGERHKQPLALPKKTIEKHRSFWEKADPKEAITPST